MTMAARLLTPLLCVSLLVPGGCDDASGSDDGASGGSTSDGAGTDADPTENPTGNSTEDPTTDPTAGSSTTSTDPSTSGPSSQTDGTEETGDPTDEPDTDDTGVGGCREEGVPCEDEMILDLGLVEGTISAGAVENSADGDGWTSAVDATAGGIVEAPSNPWVYLRFTDDGLVKVELDDLDALTSVDWDIAAKRFGIRLNSGSGGPGCVGVATLADDDYDTIEAVPEDVEYRVEAFYDDACGLVDDGSGAGGTNYALTPWWFYPGCVGVSYVPFVIETGEGRHVKFMVESYYDSGQAECNESGAMGSGSANYTWRWAYLD